MSHLRRFRFCINTATILYVTPNVFTNRPFNPKTKAEPTASDLLQDMVKEFYHAPIDPSVRHIKSSYSFNNNNEFGDAVKKLTEMSAQEIQEMSDWTVKQIMEFETTFDRIQNYKLMAGSDESSAYWPDCKIKRISTIWYWPTGQMMKDYKTEYWPNHQERRHEDGYEHWPNGELKCAPNGFECWPNGKTKRNQDGWEYWPDGAIRRTPDGTY